MIYTDQLIDIDTILKHDGIERELSTVLKETGRTTPIGVKSANAITFHAKWKEVKDDSHECWCMASKFRSLSKGAATIIKKLLNCGKVEIHPSTVGNLILTDCQDENKVEEVSKLLLTIALASDETRAAFILEHANIDEMNKYAMVYGEVFDLVNVAFEGDIRSNTCYSAWKRKDNATRRD